jgi:hypothetical protein
LNKGGAVFGPKLVLTHGPSVLAYIVFAIVLATAAIVVKTMVAHVLKRLLRLLSGRKAGELRTVTSVVRRQILTANETAFFRSLHAAVDEQYLIFPQLSLQSILEGLAQSASAQVSFTNQIDRKRVDLVLVDSQDLRVHLTIEVDDRSHEAEHRRQRHGFVESVLQRAEITLVRIPAARSYVVSTLRQQLGLLDEQSGTRPTAA